MKTLRVLISKLVRPAVAAGVGFMALATIAAGGVQAADKLTVGVPGVPPVFVSALVYTAKDAGFYKKYRLDVTVKPFDSGVAASKAVISGSVDASISPTAPAARMISNGNVPLVAIQGFEKPDWIIGSMDPAKNTCEHIKGQAVGVDSPQGARWVALSNMVRACGLLPDKDVPTVNLSSNVGAAMVAGQLTFGVLHLDDIPVIERESGKKLTIVLEIEKTSPGTHYTALFANQKNLQANRDKFVRLVAAHIEAIKFMYDPANFEKVGGYAKPTGRNLQDATNAVKMFTDFGFWPNGHSGLDRKRFDKTVQIQVMVGKKTKGKGGIKPDATPVAYDRFADLSIWNDAMALVKKSK
ncbi:MAG TPA: ABC transporter substrate-binding protein [Burkholderiales bacterium]|jgi:NitT/TauT family transport system substrate-binding protein|nr:ABC transporter substrate-binding protein [Burkholderiales bacterium]